MFDIQKALDKFEQELNSHPRKGFKFLIDRQDYKQDIGAGSHLYFKVRGIYDIDSENCTPEESISTFYAAIYDFSNKGHRNANGCDIDMSVVQHRGVMSVSAGINLPMTYTDFGDQL